MKREFEIYTGPEAIGEIINSLTEEDIPAVFDMIKEIVRQKNDDYINYAQILENSPFCIQKVPDAVISFINESPNTDFFYFW